MDGGSSFEKSLEYGLFVQHGKKSAKVNKIFHLFAPKTPAWQTLTSHTDTDRGVFTLRFETSLKVLSADILLLHL